MVDGLIKINNKEYFLKFTINSLCEMKRVWVRCDEVR